MVSNTIRKKILAKKGYFGLENVLLYIYNYFGVLFDTVNHKMYTNVY